MCVDHLLLSQVTYNNKEDSAMIHRLYGCTGPAVITVIISFHFAKRGKAHPVRRRERSHEIHPHPIILFSFCLFLKSILDESDSYSQASVTAVIKAEITDG